MSTTKNWPINTGRDGIPVSVGTSSTLTQIVPAGDQTLLIAADVMIDNPGPNDVFIQAGGASVVATANSMRVPANSVQPYGKGTTTHIAMISPAGSQAVRIHIGDGA